MSSNPSFESNEQEMGNNEVKSEVSEILLGPPMSVKPIPEYCRPNSFNDALVGYYEREEARKQLEDRIEKGRIMCLDRDFDDRRIYFTYDLSHLPINESLEKLPHNGLYFDDDETFQLSTFTKLGHPEATPQDILESFDQVFGVTWERNNGITRRYFNLKRLKWIMWDKICIPGTLRDPQGKLKHQIHLEVLQEMAIEQEQEEKEARAARMKAFATKEKRRKTIAARKKKKMEESAMQKDTESEIGPSE
jgi:hypothetical protein